MDINVNSKVTSDEYQEESEILKAEIIYVILKKSSYVSRSLRIQWFLQHLNTKIRITQRGIQDEDDSEAAIVSVIPQEPPKDWSSQNAHLYEYVVVLSTNVIFLGEVYRQVYCLDISPSVSTVDIQHGEVLLDVIIESLQESIKFLIKPFLIPGSSHLFLPDIFITVIAHTPFYISPAQQVLVQGWKISEDNVDEFLEAVLRQLEFIEDAVAQVSGAIHDQFERERKKSLIEQIELKKSTELIFSDDQEKFTPSSPNIAMVSPGSGFLNLLRYGMLALKLLPVSNFSNLVVITDGMIIMPDTDTLDSVLNHMRYNDIACYFLHVGSQFHPHCGFGFVPYTEIMQLISVATNGAYLQFPPQHRQVSGLNVYQYNFLTWNLKRKSVVSELSTPFSKDGEWGISNRHFCGNRGPQLLLKKYLENDINVTVYGVLACRIREGFILKDIFTRESELIINFTLPWTNHIYIEYTLSCQWPVVLTPAISTHYVINIKAPYEFLHDISCRNKGPIKSPFRQALIARFWRSLKSFAQSDLLLSHLESFMNHVGSYYLPEILKNGMPLYHLTPGSCQPNVGSSDVGFSQFGTIWRPACLLNNNLWQKWFHADRVGVIFKHDEPLDLFPLNFPAMTCDGMQCRQATNTLFNFLKSYCSFVLIENHSFIKFLLPNESGTGKHSFVVIRSIFKPPYAVIHLAFLYNIPGRVRLNVLNDFKRSVCALKIPRLPLQKDILGLEKSNIIVSNFNSQTNCCILLDKPLEKILIRYEQMPNEFKTVVFPDGTQPSAKSVSPLFPNRGLITTLSRYLHHRRWIWKADVGHSIFLPVSAVKTVLSTLVKIRLQEGFYFAHCSAGICNMVLEVQMKGASKDRDDHDGIYYDYHNETDDNEELHSCIIQYVIFSPKTVEIDKEDDENNETNVKIVELVSECWIEPQNGVITGCPTIRNYMSNLQYHQLPDALWSVDAKCISALFTFEYLNLMCENTNIEIPDSIQNLLTQSNSAGYWPDVAPFADQRISLIPFAFSVPNLLCQCVQEVLHFNLFSVEILEKCDVGSESNKLLLDSIYNHLSSVNNKELLFCGQDAQYFIKNFRRNFRCADKGHHSACGLFRSSDSHLSLSSSSDRFGVVPTSHDWDRMTSWAMDENDFVAQNNQPEIKPHRHFSEAAESLYSSNFDISSVSNLENADWLKWKCYIKFTTSSLCLVTVIPDSLEVIKRLFLDHKNAGQMMSESLYFDVDSRMDPEEMHSSATARNDSYSLYTSCSASSKELDEADETVDKTPESTTFRLRASTWDPVRGGLDPHGNIVDRMRTNSLGARLKPLTRLRPKRSFDLDSKEKLCENVFRTKYLPLILPIYVCKCSLTNVINYLIYKNECSRCEDNFKTTQQGLFDEDETIADNRMEEQCRSISEMFTKIFIISLFKCLHQGYDIPANDVEQAFNKCEISVLTIDITDYIKVVCKHLKHLSINTSENEKKDIKPSSYFTSSAACNELRFIHRLIKKKFTNILMLDFKQIASKPEFYYFFSSWTKESKPSSVGMLSPGLNENHSIGIEHMIPVSSANILGTWETCKESVNSEDNAGTSLISNMDSDSLNEVSNESLLDDLNPLFLKLDCNIFSENNTAKCSINVIPTCICEILKQLDKPFDLNISEFRVTIDFLCLTSPYMEVKKKAHKNGYQESSSKSFFPDDFKSNICENLVDGLSFEDGCMPKHLAQLPDYQYNALNTCMAQIKWLMKDEIVTFMLDTSPVTWDTLKMVCDHIESSSNAATCFIEKVPLSFVFRKETTSINNFLQDFNHLKIPNYQLKMEKNMYYLTKNSNERQCLFPKKDFEDFDFAGFTSDMGRIMTGSMEVVNEEQENFCQVFSSDESIFESESTKSTSFERHGSMTDGDDDNQRTLQSTVQWILERESSDAELPNFWLIMTITGDYVIVYFHCRFLEIKKKEIEDYIFVRETVIRNIKNLCKVVNQRMLLDNLHDTRLCDKLLVPDIQQDENDNESGSVITELNHLFSPGCFACNVVWETKFILHPRLKMSPIKGAVSRGIQALCSALSGFSVTNRKNLFVYKDINKNVFYLRLYESIYGCSKSQDNEDTLSGSFSRSSSFTSLSKKQFDEQLPFLLDETRSRNKSFSDASESNLLKSEDFITLKVYGITEAGNDIKTDLVQVLQNRLDDAVLDVISALLSRNSLCKLLSEDVHFIQKPNQLPSCVLQFSVHDWVTKHLYSLRYLIKQNVQLLASLPKYSDPRSSFHFQDYSVPEDSPRRISEHDIFLYNQIPTCGKGIACLAFTIVNANGDNIECIDEVDLNLKTNAFDVQPLEELKLITETHVVIPENSNEDLKTRIEFRIWKQGKINMDVLESKLNLAIRHALWELSVERNLLKYPIFEFESVNLFSVYHSLMPVWMKFGTEFSVPSIRLWEISVPIRSNLNIILRELNSKLLAYEISCYAFCKQSPVYGDNNEEDIYQPCTSFDDIIQHNGDVCLVVGRNLSLVPENTENIRSMSLEGIKLERPIQRLPSSSQEEIQVQLLKQKFIFIAIANSKIKMYIYNWTKDKIETLTKHMTDLCQWLQARSCLLSSIVQQKMGLFYNLPNQRPDLPKKILEMTTSSLDVLLKFPVSFHKSNTALQLNRISDSFRDVRLSKATRDKLEDKNPFIQNVNQLREVQKIDRKSQHKQLHSLWQAKAVAANTSVSEEMLNNFSLQGRLIHYCLTPLLFMPSWRLQAAATRDHSLSLKTQSENDELVKGDVEEKWKWHNAICSNFINEYKQYLQSMGFFPVQKPREQTSKAATSVSPFENENKNIHYMQKYLLGGVLLYELSFAEPFFNSKLYAMEYARLNTKNNSLLSQFTISFLDDCDRIKFQMHLHSFTYDYHLRCLHQFITDQQPSLRYGYHMVDFLDDFMKYYPKAPNYARSLVHTETVSVDDVQILPTQLFDYLLANGKNYNMDAFCMSPQYSSNDIAEDNEYVLIRNKSTSAVCYKDANDIQQSEDFDIIIIISHIPDSQEKTIKFQIYILITSRRELYPKMESEQKLGKFRTVSTSYDLASSNEEDIDVQFSIYDGSGSSKESQELREPRKKKTSHVEIKQEFVNYLGYYSSHEEAMQNLMMDEVEDAKKFIEWMVVQGAFDCETHILWNRLLCPSTSPLSYQELQHLVSLADVYEISNMDEQLKNILNQPISWLQSFVKALVAKLPECCHLFSSGNTQELLILHPQYSGGFVRIVLNIQKNTCTTNLVYRKGMCNGEETQFELQTLFEQIINTYCFHLWLDAF